MTTPSYIWVAQGLTTTPHWRWSGAASVLPDGIIVGEMDGDDLSEIAVTDAVSQTVEIFSGTLASMEADYTITNTDDTRFGMALANGGSPDADIYSDLIVSTGQETAIGGTAWIYSGSSPGTDSESDVVAGLPGEDGIAFGFAAASIGDINGDGNDDFAISAAGYGETDTENRIGSVGVWHGDIVGPEEVPNRLLSFGISSDHYGSAIAGGVDLNDNTFADLVVGAPLTGTTGSVYLHFGAFNSIEDNPGADALTNLQRRQ